MKKSSPETLFKEIAAFVADSRALLSKGAMMEMAGLDERVRLLCAQVVELSQEERLRYADRLQQLLGDLTSLGQDMEKQHTAMADELRHLSDHRKASVAYRTGDSRDGFGKKEDES